MRNKKILKSASIVTILIVASVIVFVLGQDGQFEAIRDSVLALTIYSLVFLVYGLRIAFFVIGLVALYRILWNSVNNKELNRTEV